MTEKEKQTVFKKIFSIMAPGQSLRSAVDRIQEASLGALIILSDLDDIEEYVEGGFILNTEFSPQKIYELAKMDGAIVISSDIKKIYGANLQLQPNHTIITDESGTRHRTAHRMAKQTGHMVITVSERRNKITVFKNDYRYSLSSIGDLLIKSSQAITSLEKYSSIIIRYLTNLNYLETEDLVIIEDIIKIIRFYILLFNMENKIDEYITELGSEGITIELQRKEIMMGHKNTFINLIKDYSNSKEKAEKIFERITNIDKLDIVEDESIYKFLGYDTKIHHNDSTLKPKGYRLLNSLSSLTKRDVETIIDEFKDFNSIINLSVEDLENVKGINKNKAYKVIKLCEKYKNSIQIEAI